MRHAAPRLSSWWPSLRERACACWTSAGASSSMRLRVRRIVGPEIESAAMRGRRRRRRRARRARSGRPRARRRRSRSRARESLARSSGLLCSEAAAPQARKTLPFAVRWYGTRFPTQFVEPMKCRLSRWESWSTPSGVGTPRFTVSPDSSASASRCSSASSTSVTSGSVRCAKRRRTGPGPHRRAIAVALEEALPLERGEEPGGGALRQLGGLGELADSERPRALDDAHEQLRGPVDCLTSGHNPYYGTTSSTFRKSVATLRGSAACS